MRPKDKHEFALYYEHMPQLALKSLNQDWCVEDKDIVHRITKILRLKPCDTIVFFNATIVLHCTIQSFNTKNTIVVHTTAIQHPVAPKPTIVALLPVLKRIDFETAMSELTTLGVTTIIPVNTEKSSTEVNTSPERLTRIAQACAEQSKQFFLPTIHQTLPLDKALAHSLLADCTKIFFDPQGAPLHHILYRNPSTANPSYALLIGPEGDLSHNEKQSLINYNFHFCSLTPSILRAHQAIFLGAGIIRSWYHSSK